MEPQIIGGEDKKELVRNFSNKWYQEEPYNSLALGVAVAASNPAAPVNPEESFKHLYQGDADGDALIEGAKINLEKSSKILKANWDHYLEEKGIDKMQRSDYIFEPKGDDMFAEFAAHIKSSVEDWKSRKRSFGKAREYAWSCCDTLSNHSNFFSIFPKDNPYCSVFCGVLKTLVKAGANHKEIGNKLNKTIESINDQVKLCQLDSILMQTKDIRALIMRLYAEAFELFDLILRYLSSQVTRFRDAFNENAFERKFGGYVRAITDITDRIRKRAELGSRAELRDVNLSTIYWFQKLDKKLQTEAEERKQAEKKTLKELKTQEKILQEIKTKQENSLNFTGAALYNIGTSGHTFLIESYIPEGPLSRALSDNRARTPCLFLVPQDVVMPPSSVKAEKPGGHSAPQLEERAVTETVQKQAPVYTFDDIKTNAGIIKAFLIRNPLPLADAEGPTNSGILPQPEVLTALQSWTQANGLQILWIHGLDGDKHRKSFTNLVKVVVANAADFDVNMMYFSCDPYSGEYSDAGNDEEVQKRCLLDLTYVLIWQLVQILPHSLRVDGDFSAGRFKACNQDYNSIKAAVIILQDLLEVAPPVAMVVIDGIERLSHPAVERDVTYILQLLTLYTKEPDMGVAREMMRPDSNSASYRDKSFKMLFVTARPCQALTELYELYEDRMKRVLVSWQKWHQYGKDVDLF